MGDDAVTESLPGRADALALLANALERVGTGRRTIVLVEGEPGVGKTTLLRHALGGRPATVVWAAGDENEVDLDHGVIEQLVRGAPLAEEHRRSLLRAATGDPLAVGAAIVGLVDGFVLDPGRPLVVVVDDAQWADESSLRALTFAARRLRRDPVALCVVTRSGHADRLPRGLRQLVDEEGAHVVLAPLDRSAVRQVAEQALGQPISATAAERLQTHTQGNPLHLRTLLEELPADALTGTGHLPSPRSFSTLVLARLAGAGPATEALVVAVAVLGEPVPLGVAARLAELDDPGPALDPALELGLLAATPAADGGLRLEIAHPLVRAAVLDDLPVGRRSTLHRRAGSMLPGLAGLRHRLQGTLGPDGQLWDDAVAAAATEAARGAHSSAAALLRSAAAVAPDEERRSRAVLEAADQLVLAGRPADAAALRPAVDALEPSPHRSFVQGRLAYVLGPRRAAGELLEAAWTGLGGAVGGAGADGVAAVDRGLAGRVAAMLATTSVDRADGARAAAWSRLALSLDPDQAAAASAGHMLAASWALIGHPEDGLADLDQLCAAVDRAGALAPAVADARAARGLLRLWTHDLDGAAQDLEASLAAGAGSFVARESCRTYLAEVRYRQGRWDEAIVLAELASSLVEDTDQVWMAALPHATAARPRAARGEPAGHHLDRAGAAVEVAGGVAAALTQVAVLDVAASERDLDAALAAGSVLASMARRVDERIAPWRAAYVEALVAAGQIDDAAEVARDLEAAASSAGSTALTRADAARAAAAVAAARGDEDRADALVADALAAPPDAAGPFPRARLELAAGRMWRRRGERRRAAGVLREAAARFSALGAAPWLAQAEREVSALGLRPVRGGARPGAGRSPPAQAGGHQVGRGPTNPVGGPELVVSAKTVEHHLSRIYAKLGVRSRTELARTFPPAP